MHKSTSTDFTTFIEFIEELHKLVSETVIMYLS